MYIRWTILGALCGLINSVSALSTRVYVFNNKTRQAPVILIADNHCEEGMPVNEHDLVRMQARDILKYAKKVNAHIVIEDMTNYTGPSAYIKKLFDIENFHKDFALLPYITQGVKKSKLSYTNLEYRHELELSLENYPISAGKGFGRTESILNTISAFNDSPQLNNHYRQCIDEVMPAHTHLKSIFNLRRRLAHQLNSPALCEQIMESAPTISLFYDKKQYAHDPEQFVRLYDWRLLNQLIIHEIYQRHWAGDLATQAQPIFVFAGGAHIVEIADVLEKYMDYYLVSDSYQGEYHYRLDLEPVSNYEPNTIWAFLEADKFFNNSLPMVAA